MSRLRPLVLPACDWREPDNDPDAIGSPCRNNAEWELHCCDGWLGSYCDLHARRAKERHDQHCAISRVAAHPDGGSRNE